MLRRLALATTLVLSLPVLLPAQQRSVVSPATHWDLGYHAWDAGKYIDAIDHFRAMLTPNVERHWVDSVAVLTGELFPATEITDDGARPSWSMDGRSFVYETGVAANRVSRVVRRNAPQTVVAEVPGGGAALSPSGALVAWLGMPGNNVMVRDLASGRDLPVSGLDGWTANGVTFGADDGTLFVVVSRASDGTRNDILRLSRTVAGFAATELVTPTIGYKGVPVPLPGGRYLVYMIPAGNPVRLPTGAAGLRAAAAFGILDLQTKSTRRIEGASPTVSADGLTIAWVERGGAVSSANPGITTDFSRIMVAPIAGGDAVVAWKGGDRIDAPALSPDGKRIAFQRMLVYDWELFVVDATGGNEFRLTREIQHDLMPQWLNPNTILAVMGEGRHRRSYIYNAMTGSRTRLFHNNTIRTIAPEYEWVPSPDGMAILTVAERDGNTVSPERGLYLSGHAGQVTREAVLDRLATNRASEVSLRDRGLATFRPIAAAVRAVTTQVDVSRIYQYEKALFDFDSKHITMPGNAKASAYLEATYRGFGYTPEMQWFEPRGALGGKTANVLAVLKGTENPELVYVVSSHYDSRAEGPGADDNTSGTAALLEAARVMAKHPQPATIIFASFTGEEAGLLGSREFVRRAVADSVKLVGALNNDMLGWANDHRLDNTIRYSNPGIRDIQHAAAAQFSAMITYDALYYKSTDAAAYYEAYGDIVGGIGSYPVLGNPHYHMVHDVLEVENHQLIAEASKTTVATLMLLASSPSRLKGLAVANGVVIWAKSPEKSVTGYLVTWGPANAPEQQRMRVTGRTARIPGLRSGMVVQVKAVNAKGLEGWDWARVVVP